MGNLTGHWFMVHWSLSNDVDSELIPSEFELNIQYLNNTLIFTITTESDSIYNYKISKNK